MLLSIIFIKSHLFRTEHDPDFPVQVLHWQCHLWSADQSFTTSISRCVFMCYDSSQAPHLDSRCISWANVIEISLPRKIGKLTYNCQINRGITQIEQAHRKYAVLLLRLQRVEELLRCAPKRWALCTLLWMIKAEFGCLYQGHWPSGPAPWDSTKWSMEHNTLAPAQTTGLTLRKKRRLHC